MDTQKRKYQKRVPLISVVGAQHGESHTPLHQKWCGIVQRCKDKNHHKYHRYGGRGIMLCEEWHTYTNFRDWALANGYEKGLTIDRKDNDGNYEPNNCRFVLEEIQKYNRSNNRIIEYNGEKKALGQWAKQYNLNPCTIDLRLKSGWDIEKALTFPNRQKQKVPYEKGTRKGNTTRTVIKLDLNGNEVEVYKSVREAAINSGVSEKGLYNHCVIKKREIEYHGFKWKTI